MSYSDTLNTVLCSQCQAHLTRSNAMFLEHLLTRFSDFMFLRVCRAVPFLVCCMFYVFVTVLHCTVSCIFCVLPSWRNKWIIIVLCTHYLTQKHELTRSLHSSCSHWLSILWCNLSFVSRAFHFTHESGTHYHLAFKNPTNSTHFLHWDVIVRRLIFAITIISF